MTLEINNNLDSTNEYFKSLCEKFPNIKFNMTTDKVGSGTQLTVNLSPKLVEKMSKNPKLAEDIEKALSTEPATFEWLKNMCKTNGQELSTRYVVYDENGESVSSSELRTISNDNFSKIHKYDENRNKNIKK
ncbi:DUF6033 family protein [Clostridium sp. MB40-C1]|uniref:DUF6033 family protein n=1 Tax=Clostridium sp. MB40-C1 TaxID=3070996 RepID=UPI0027DFD454|nr:DUF6033 family protein [Clostridium sp. MB40-C1]WMJ81746.1 DUF6033 family protein [Clostridium sp. MB40-C1]